MSATRLWPIWLIFAGVFLAGGVTGGFISLRVAKTVVKEGRAPDQFTPRMMERLGDGLELSVTQRAAIKPLVDGTWEKLRQTRRESVELMRTMEKEISALLTAEQRAVYDQMQARQREHWNSMTERRGPRRGERGERGEEGREGREGREDRPRPPPPEKPQP